MKKLIFLICFLSTSIFAQKLPANAPERQQLIAMGAEILLEEPSDKYTVALFGKNKIAFEKHSDRLVATRYFTRKKGLNSSEEFELLKLINKFNKEHGYQFSLYDNFIAASMYNYGNHDAKNFAAIVRFLDKVEVVFDENPSIYKLVNE